MTTHAPLRSQWTKAQSVYHVRGLGDGESPTSLIKIQGYCASAPLRGSAGNASHSSTLGPLYAFAWPFLNPAEHSCACLFDQLIRLEEERRGDREAERLGSLEVDD